MIRPTVASLKTPATFISFIKLESMSRVCFWDLVLLLACPSQPSLAKQLDTKPWSVKPITLTIHLGLLLSLWLSAEPQPEFSPSSIETDIIVSSHIRRIASKWRDWDGNVYLKCLCKYHVIELHKHFKRWIPRTGSKETPYLRLVLMPFP